CLEGENVTQPASAQRHALVGTFIPPSVKDHVTYVQKQQEASSIANASSSSPGTQTIAHDTIDTLPPSECCLSSSPASRVFARRELEWGYTFFIRLDFQGFFHTYPKLGGPYQSLQEADKAIDRHYEKRRDPKMSREQDDDSPINTIMRRCLFWPDGTSKRRSKSRGIENGRDKIRRLVLALLDKYNEDHHLVEDLACELKDVLNFQPICEEASWYYHLNFIATSKAGGDQEVFAEVKHLMQGKHLEMIVCCFCMVDPTDKGQHCKGCTLIGNVDMKHPDSSVELAAGHSDPRCCQLISGESDSEDEDTFAKAKEAELRERYKVMTYLVPFVWALKIDMGNASVNLLYLSDMMAPGILLTFCMEVNLLRVRVVFSVDSTVLSVLQILAECCLQ
ncbi:hypothetical protein EJB05_05399, partial [Eragrostis curvula]